MSTKTKPGADWFAVDKKGLGQLLEGRGKAFAVLELISNAWDQTVTRVDVTLTPLDKRATYELVVSDDDPDGFADLGDAFTLFAPSGKKGHAEKRGRFNLGEKLVLALCETATISSTTGTIVFDDTGRSRTPAKRDRGSEFRGVVHMTKAEYEDTCRVIATLIPPVATFFNGAALNLRAPVHEFTASLPSVLADEEGNLRPTTRKTTVRVFDPLPGETATIYEMGIPVVENGDRWHYDICQKVPLNMDRDNVKPSYLRTLRTLVTNEMHQQITVDDANSTWVKEALEDDRITPDAVTTIVTQRFGEKVVSYDMSDPEANNLAVSQGYTVVHGRSLSKDAWANVRSVGAILPAGKVTPSNTQLLQQALNAEGGDQDRSVPEEKWTAGMRAMATYAKELSLQLIGYEVAVEIVSDVTLPAAAYFGGRRLTFNVGRLGHRWFDQPDQFKVDELLIHEFAHDKAHNHLDHSFHDECCRLGARMRTVTVQLSAFPVAASS